MRPADTRRYDVVVRIKRVDKTDCRPFHLFIREAAELGREVTRYNAASPDDHCEVEMHIRCVSAGKSALHRFERTV